MGKFDFDYFLQLSSKLKLFKICIHSASKVIRNFDKYNTKMGRLCFRASERLTYINPLQQRTSTGACSACALVYTLYKKPLHKTYIDKIQILSPACSKWKYVNKNVYQNNISATRGVLCQYQFYRCIVASHLWVSVKMLQQGTRLNQRVQIIFTILLKSFSCSNFSVLGST